MRFMINIDSVNALAQLLLERNKTAIVILNHQTEIKQTQHNIWLAADCDTVVKWTCDTLVSETGSKILFLTKDFTDCKIRGLRIDMFVSDVELSEEQEVLLRTRWRYAR